MHCWYDLGAMLFATAALALRSIRCSQSHARLRARMLWLACWLAGLLAVWLRSSKAQCQLLTVLAGSKQSLLPAPFSPRRIQDALRAGSSQPKLDRLRGAAQRGGQGEVGWQAERSRQSEPRQGEARRRVGHLFSPAVAGCSALSAACLASEALPACCPFRPPPTRRIRCARSTTISIPSPNST